MQELYVDINRMGIILTVDEKIKQLEQLFALIEVQQTMFMGHFFLMLQMLKCF